MQYGAVAPPIYQTGNFCFPDVATMRASLAQEMDVPFYTRGNNPTVGILRKKLAALEGAEEALVFGSGSAAVAAAVMSGLSAGDHVVCVQKPYSWTGKLLKNILGRFGVTHTFIDGTKVENWEAACLPNTKMFILESPNSWTFELQDIPAVAKLAQSKGIRTVIDNSYASPLNQQPISMGIDIVVHSASKYLSGHSDMVAGVLCCSRAIAEEVFQGEYMTLGGIVSPNEAWLMIRGLRTLQIRMDRVAETTPKVVAFLEQHPKVEKVIYPFAESHPQHELAKQLMKKGTGQFSILLKADDIEACERFVDGLHRFLLACSWGGHESLVFPMCTLYGSMNYANSPLPWNFIRFYAGLEDADVLIEDLGQALDLV